MTYCVGFLVSDGLVMMADTRTNAGVDNISSCRKLRVHGEEGGDRLIATASAGSLSTTQGALHRLAQGVPNPRGPRWRQGLAAPCSRGGGGYRKAVTSKIGDMLLGAAAVPLGCASAQGCGAAQPTHIS